jgi:hypothetical protein
MFGMSPWGAGSNFVDPYARWIWNTPEAAYDAPNNEIIAFEYTFNGPPGVLAVIHVIADNQGAVYVAGAHRGFIQGGGWWHPEGPTSIIYEMMYSQTIRIEAYNEGGPAGILVSVVRQDDTSIVYARTDSRWGWSLA